MKPLRLNKVIGLSIGERSLMAAEVVSGDRPEVKRLAEFVYPDGVSTQQPAELGAALGAFLRDNKFTGKSAVVGLPARWLVVKAKEVPPADHHTLANMLRLQAEGEFSTELKDLVYDYTADDSRGNPKTVLLVATSKRYIDGAVTMCDAAKLSAVRVTPSAIALGIATSRSAGASNPLVLAVSSAGAELTSQSGDAASAIRHLRGPGPDRPFVGELRRAISGMPGAAVNGSGAVRELVLWDAAGQSIFDSATLGESLGMPVRNGDLPILGVDAASSSLNGNNGGNNGGDSGGNSGGDSRKYAAAVALALSAMVDANQSVDFLHSRLAPPKPPLVPHWIVVSVLAAVVLLGSVFFAYRYLQKQQNALDVVNGKLASVEPDRKSAEEFVTKVSFAQAWHLGSPRYLTCLRDLTSAIPQDGQTYATTLTLKENVPQATSGAPPVDAVLKTTGVRTLSGILDAKTIDQQHAQLVLDRLKKITTTFTNVKPGGSQEGGGRGREVLFRITFDYVPPKNP